MFPRIERIDVDRRMRFVNICEMRCQVIMTYLMRIEHISEMTLKVHILNKLTAATYMYTWVVMIHDLRVMTSIRMDAEFVMPTVPRIHLSADRSLSTIQELHKRIAETCIQGVEVIWSTNSSLDFPR